MVVNHIDVPYNYLEFAKYVLGIQAEELTNVTLFCIEIDGNLK